MQGHAEPLAYTDAVTYSDRDGPAAVRLALLNDAVPRKPRQRPPQCEPAVVYGWYLHRCYCPRLGCGAKRSDSPSGSRVHSDSIFAYQS